MEALGDVVKEILPTPPASQEVIRELAEKRLVPVERHDLKNGRWYAPLKEWWEENRKDEDRPFYPSVTTVIGCVMDKGIGYEKWLGNAVSYENAKKYANERATIGSVVHDMCESLLWGAEIDLEGPEGAEEKWIYNDEPYPITTEIKKYLMSFVTFVKQSKMEMLTTEIAILSFNMEISGTADIVAYLTDKKGNRNLWLLDIKTGNEYETHKLQLQPYTANWNEAFPEYPIERHGDLYLKSGKPGRRFM